MHSKKSRSLRTNLDVIKFYFERYRYFKNNIGQITEYDVLITHQVVRITLERLLQLMEKEWEGTFGE